MANPATNAITNLAKAVRILSKQIESQNRMFRSFLGLYLESKIRDFEQYLTWKANPETANNNPIKLSPKINNKTIEVMLKAIELLNETGNVVIETDGVNESDDNGSVAQDTHPT